MGVDRPHRLPLGDLRLHSDLGRALRILSVAPPARTVASGCACGGKEAGSVISPERPCARAGTDSFVCPAERQIGGVLRLARPLPWTLPCHLLRRSLSDPSWPLCFNGLSSGSLARQTAGTPLIIEQGSVE